MMKHAALIQVYLHVASEKKFLGRLAAKDRRFYFEYDPVFLQTGIQISPFKLPLKAGVIACDTTLFEGIFGVFNDSLPDGWGRLLLDRKLTRMGQVANELTPLDRLLFVGDHGMGAISYEPAIEDGDRPLPHQNLDTIAHEIQEFQNNDDQFLDELLTLNGSSAGARPKAMLKINGEDWLVKFKSSLDPIDIGSIEFAYHNMAIAAGLDVPAAKLFPSKICPGFFGVKRFDRDHDERVHMHSVSGLLHADHRAPSLDYQAIMKATLLLTKDYHECEKQFRAAVFNVFAHNRDDHAKNFSFLLGFKTGWRVSPAYDLTFSSGPGGEHCTMVMGEGSQPGVSHLIKLAEISGIKKERALIMIEEVKSAVADWNKYASDAGVSQKTMSAINKILVSNMR